MNAKKQKEFKVIIGTNDPRVKDEHFYELALKIEQYGNSTSLGPIETPLGLRVHISEVEDKKPSLKDIGAKPFNGIFPNGKKNGP